MKKLSSELKEKYGKGFDFSSLYKYMKFHQEFPQILDSLRAKSGRPLSWTHYRILLQETSPEARVWYAKEAQEQAWSVRTLQRNISSQYYYRMLMSQNTEPVEKEMKELTATYQADKLEFIKNPVIAEFLGLSSNTDFTESELEQRIITHIQKFLMELGKGYAFVARQQHIRTEKEDYYIDLVFYNYILKCFVLKMNPLRPPISTLLCKPSIRFSSLCLRNASYTICVIGMSLIPASVLVSESWKQYPSSPS